MQTRRLGNTTLELSVIGLGTWAIGGGGWKFGWGKQDEQEAVAGIVRAVECGVNWIDTAPVYGDGQAETLVGRALSQLNPSDRPLVATKFGRIIEADGAIKAVLAPESIRSECEASLQRLGVDQIDLYQMHWPDPDPEIETAWETMAALKAEGKVREIGVSNFSVAQMERVAKIHPIASLQPQYNLLHRQIETAQLPYCAENQIGVVAYSPMGKGLLTGKFTAERAASLAATDHRSRDPQFAKPQLSVHLELVEKLKALAADAGRDPVQLAIAWVLRRPAVTSAIIGTRRPEQIEQTVKAHEWQLTAEQIMQIDEYLSDHDQRLAALNA